MALALLLALSAAADAQQIGEYTQPYLLDNWKPDYTHVPNLGDKRVTFVVHGTTRVTVGPQQDFDRLYEVQRLVNHKERRVRLAAVLELKTYRSMKSARLITSLLGDPDYEIREACAWALGEMGYRSAIRPLIDALEYTHNDRSAIVHALRKLTGKNFGDSYRRWWAWYEAVRRDG